MFWVWLAHKKTAQKGRSEKEDIMQELAQGNITCYGKYKYPPFRERKGQPEFVIKPLHRHTGLNPLKKLSSYYERIIPKAGNLFKKKRLA